MGSVNRSARVLGILILAVVAWGVAPAQAKSYVADRFDSSVEVLRGGTLRVTETVVFRFQDGTFREVFREIPSRNADGVEFVSAAMDGRVLAEGDGAGQVEVRRRSRLRVTWHFEPTRDSRHTFELVYLVHGAVREGTGGDEVAWRALPGKHGYRIESSELVMRLPEPPADAPRVATRRTASSSTRLEGSEIRVRASGVRPDGWFEVWTAMPRGSVISEAPAWQRLARAQRAAAPGWWAGTAAVLLAVLVLLFAVHQGYDSPPPDSAHETGGPALPDALPPAEAGALAAGGSARLEHAMAALMHLADRGILTVGAETKTRLGQRQFVLTRQRGAAPLTTYEQALLDVAFKDTAAAGTGVSLEKVRTRVTRHFKAFGRALEAELRGHGLIDEGRKAIKDRYAAIAIGLALAGGIVAIVVALLLLRRFGPWPMLVPLGLGVGALIALICHSAHTALSNEGLRRARHWRGFKKYIRDVSRDEVAPPGGVEGLLSFAVALGAAAAWSKYLSKHRIATPAWFHAATAHDAAPAFVAFVAHGGAPATSGGASGTGAAGGGASGAR